MKSTGVSYRPCPNKLAGLRAIQNGGIAQVRNALGDLVCMACGNDHTTGRTKQEITLSIKQHWATLEAA